MSSTARSHAGLKCASYVSLAMTKRIGVAGVLATVAVHVVVAASPGSSSPSAEQAIPIPATSGSGGFRQPHRQQVLPAPAGHDIPLPRDSRTAKPMTVSVSITHKTKIDRSASARRSCSTRCSSGASPRRRPSTGTRRTSAAMSGTSVRDSSDYVKGKWVRSDGSWEAGVDGAKAGIVMKAAPAIGKAYRQEFYASRGRHGEGDRNEGLSQSALRNLRPCPRDE